VNDQIHIERLVRDLLITVNELSAASHRPHLSSLIAREHEDLSLACGQLGRVLERVRPVNQLVAAE
jgi:hypothetical protein